MSDLRTGLVEAMKSAIGASFVEQMGWGESKPMAALEVYAVANEQAVAALDAALGFLTDHADEWPHNTKFFQQAIAVLSDSRDTGAKP